MIRIGIAIGLLLLLSACVPAQSLPEDCRLNSVFECKNYDVNADNETITLELKSFSASDVQIHQISITNTNDPNIRAVAEVPQTVIRRGNTATIQGSIENANQLVSGKKGAFEMTILYSKTGSSMQRTIDGTLITKVK